MRVNTKKSGSPPLEELEKAAREIQEHISKKLKRQQENAAGETGEGGEDDGDSDKHNDTLIGGELTREVRHAVQTD